MALALYRKYRPQTFQELIDQNHITIILEQEVLSGKVAHAYLFSGPRGTGKTSTARIFSKAINCQNSSQKSEDKRGEPCNVCEACVSITEGKALDVIEIDAASYTGVDNVRETIIETAKFAPSRLKYKIFIIDEVHMLSNSAWNALLKIMEEPPAHVIFILATTEIRKVPQTILSRCQRFDFHRVHQKEMVERLTFLAKQEKIKVVPAVLETVARLSEGCVRDAESILEQLFSLGEKEVTEDVAALVLPRTSWVLVLEFLEVISSREARRGLALVERLVSEGIDLAQFTSDLIEMTRKILLIKIAGKQSVAAGLDGPTAMQLEKFAGNMTEARILEVIDLFIKTKQAQKGSSIPQLPLEIAVVEECEVEKGGDPRTLRAPIGEPAENTRPRTTSGDVDDIPRGAPARVDNRPILDETNIMSTLRKGSPQAPLKTPTSVRDIVQSPRKGGGEEKKEVISLAEIKEKWAEVLKQAQVENHSLPFLLSTSEPLTVEGDMVTIGLQYEFHRDKLNEPKCRTVLEKIVSEVYGIPLRVVGTLMAQKELVANSVDDILSTLGGRVVE
ncbi:MAG: DNA polymerase III subunit gamma/tau [bacterium]|nr:DNA polymerase III subunit gamma/tau [bacterium]